MPILNGMLQLGNCAKGNSKIFLLNRKVSKLSFGNIKFDWKFLGQNSKFKIQNLRKKCKNTFRCCQDFVIHEKSPLMC